jgi:hypothetical protein
MEGIAHRAGVKDLPLPPPTQPFTRGPRFPSTTHLGDLSRRESGQQLAHPSVHLHHPGLQALRDRTGARIVVIVPADVGGWCGVMWCGVRGEIRQAGAGYSPNAYIRQAGAGYRPNEINLSKQPNVASAGQ